MTTFLALLFISVAVLLILVVLVQRGRGGGLAGAFGSGGGSSSAFGTKTGDVFTAMTVVLFVVFMLLAIWLNFRFQAYKETNVLGQPTVTTEPAIGSTTLPAGSGSFTPATLPATPPPVMPIEPMMPTTSTSQPK